MPTMTNVAIAQIRSVQRKPYRSRSACRRNGKANPAAGEDEAGCETAPPNEPLRQEDDDGIVQEPSGRAEDHALQHDEKPYLAASQQQGQSRDPEGDPDAWSQ